MPVRWGIDINRYKPAPPSGSRDIPLVAHRLRCGDQRVPTCLVIVVCEVIAPGGHPPITRRGKPCKAGPQGGGIHFQALALAIAPCAAGVIKAGIDILGAGCVDAGDYIATPGIPGVLACQVVNLFRYRGQVLIAALNRETSIRLPPPKSMFSSRHVRPESPAVVMVRSSNSSIRYRHCLAVLAQYR